VLCLPSRILVIFKAAIPFALYASLAAQTSAPGSRAAYLNPDLPLNIRVDDLVSRMTLEEKASQLVNQSREIPRLKSSGVRLVERGTARSGARGSSDRVSRTDRTRRHFRPSAYS
jgi:hypothetical protein